MYDQIRTETWTILIPSDWVEGENTSSKAHYFESGDGEKAVYIATWNLGQQPRALATDVAESFLQTDLRSMKTMDGYAWQHLDRSVSVTGTIAIAVADNYAAAQSYRIACKILARPPVVVRASFHDYACHDLPASQRFFRPIMDSLGFCQPSS